jgi:hypothetical protein
MKPYATSQPNFYKTANSGATDRLSKYRDIISPPRIEVGHHRSEATMSRWKDSTFRGVSGEKPARAELMGKTKIKPEVQAIPLRRDSSRTINSHGRSASRTEASIARLDYFYKHSNEAKSSQPKLRAPTAVENKQRLSSPRESIPVPSNTKKTYEKPVIHISAEKSQHLRTPPRVSYRLPINSSIGKEDTSVFSEKILTILGNQQQQLQVIMNEMQKVTSLVSGKNSTSGSKMAALSADGQASDIHFGSEVDKEAVSIKPDGLKSAGTAFRPKDNFNSSEISHSNQPQSRVSRGRKNLFSNQKGFEEDKISRADSSPISKTSVDEINLNELSERELMELKKRIDSKLTDKSDGIQRFSSLKSAHKPSDLILKKLGKPSYLHLPKESIQNSQKPPLGNARPK